MQVLMLLMMVVSVLAMQMVVAIMDVRGGAFSSGAGQRQKSAGRGGAKERVN